MKKKKRLEEVTHQKIFLLPLFSKSEQEYLPSLIFWMWF